MHGKIPKAMALFYLRPIELFKVGSYLPLRAEYKTLYAMLLTYCMDWVLSSAFLGRLYKAYTLV